MLQKEYTKYKTNFHPSLEAEKRLNIFLKPYVPKTLKKRTLKRTNSSSKDPI